MNQTGARRHRQWFLSVVLSSLLVLSWVATIQAQTIDDDLCTGWIHRLPEIDYVPNSDEPWAEGWPAEDEIVTWQACVRSWYSVAQTDVEYRWYLDGVELDSGTVTLAADDWTVVELPWSWTFERHELRFIIDSADHLTEFEESNNELTVFTDAISVGFWVEESVYDYFHQHQHELGVGANSWEDWSKRQVDRWNQMFPEAIYPDSPAGVLDRIRCDKIVVVPDGALPLAWGYYPTNHPDTSDKTVDLMWGFPATLLDGSRYHDHTTISDNNHFYYEGSLLHELGHARYLIDVYGFNVGSGQVLIEEDGIPIADTDYMPIIANGVVYYTPVQGLMNGHYTYVDSYSTVALNLIAGHRAHNGNYNAPYNIGEFLQDLPEENALTITSESGTPLAGVEVEVYTAQPQPGVWYGKLFDDVPDLSLTADDEGTVLLGRCPFSADGTITHYWEWSNGTLILRVDYQGDVHYGFFTVMDLNHEYWRGNTDLGHYTIPFPVATGVETPAVSALHLSRNYPNPFNPATTIHYSIQRAMPVTLTVCATDGRHLATLFRGDRQPGEYDAVWRGEDDAGRPLASGVYLCRLQAGSESRSSKLVLIR